MIERRYVVAFWSSTGAYHFAVWPDFAWDERAFPSAAAAVIAARRSIRR